ncbi:uncharacterized protein CLUP02_09722 [Colletotrichum lupini]|uniref:Uncharacterized protein n=1 Tax=Colletotrichum lupini TaxID=145971 RepID=A0A9Q8SVD0_9PEZI|nr:uncharacterized protein CLUP02_09722 [Colletotrichum lupini]UQC84226.1 hypothetical protein CLUP02_09722 [Colletotrichum lupini]
MTPASPSFFPVILAPFFFLHPSSPSRHFRPLPFLPRLSCRPSPRFVPVSWRYLIHVPYPYTVHPSVYLDPSISHPFPYFFSFLLFCFPLHIHTIFVPFPTPTRVRGSTTKHKHRHLHTQHQQPLSRPSPTLPEGQKNPNQPKPQPKF